MVKWNDILNDDYKIKTNKDYLSEYFTIADRFYRHLRAAGFVSCKEDYRYGSISAYNVGYCYAVDIDKGTLPSCKPYAAGIDGFGFGAFPFGMSDPLSASGSWKLFGNFFNISNAVTKGVNHNLVMYLRLESMADNDMQYRQKAISPPLVPATEVTHDMGFGGSYENTLNDDKFENYYRVTAITYYINDNDGNYNELNPREIYNADSGYYTSVVVPFYLNGWKDSSTSEYETKVACVGISLDNLLGIYASIKTSDYYNYREHVNYTNGINADIYGYENLSYYENPTGQLFGNLNEVIGNTKLRKTVYFTKETLTKILNDIGIPYTFNINEALNNNTSNFTNYKPSGKPENPIYPPSGDGDNSSDDFEIITPTYSPYDSYTTTYLCRKADINNLSNYMWSDDFINQVIRLFENPSELITNNIFFPYSLTENQTLPEPEQITIGNVNAPTNTTGIPVTALYNRRRATDPYVYTSYFGSFLDYEPYSHYLLYLPYIGFVKIDGNDVIKHALRVEYVSELETGNCTAYIYSDTRLVAQYNGELGTPIGLSNTNQILKNLKLTGATVQIASGIAGAIASKGAGGTSAISSGISDFISSFAEQTIHTGDKVGGLNSLYSPQDVYLVVFHAIPAEATGIKEIFGKSASYGGAVADFSGFLQCSAVDGYTKGTDDENNEIFELLRGGIYV